MYALPHHIASFETSTTGRSVVPGIKLQTPTKGNATAVVANQWRFTEASLPSKYAWLPNDGFGLSDPAVSSVIGAALRKEIQQDFVSGSNIDSMYFAGKVGFERCLGA